MADGQPPRQLGFASFFADPSDVSLEVPLPTKSPLPLVSTRPNVLLGKSLASRSGHSAGSPAASEKKAGATGGSGHHRSERHARKSGSREKRNFKCLSDPVLDKSKPKGSKAIFRYDGEQASFVGARSVYLLT